MALERTGADSMPAYQALTSHRVSIGIDSGGEPEVEADVESTLIFAAASGMEHGSLRRLSVLTTWLGVHHAHVNAGRLIRLVREQPAERTCTYWAGIAHWLRKNRCSARVEGLYKGPPRALLEVGTDFQIERRGGHQRFVGSKLRVPSGTLRDRASYVLAPEALVKRHTGYGNRMLVGPSFRAEAWTVLEKSPGCRWPTSHDEPLARSRPRGRPCRTGSSSAAPKRDLRGRRRVVPGNEKGPPGSGGPSSRSLRGGRDLNPRPPA